jgi:hypothetical protein
MRDEYVDIYCLSLALKYYSAEQLKHTLQVAEYAVNAYSYLAADSDLKKLWKIGLFHDILEDTSCPEKELGTVLSDFELKTVKLLTHSNEKSYLEYIHNIVNSRNFFAQAVKRADMKDHLMREATLTDKLKEKYYPVIKYLL